MTACHERGESVVLLSRLVCSGEVFWAFKSSILHSPGAAYVEPHGRRMPAYV